MPKPKKPPRRAGRPRRRPADEPADGLVVVRLSASDARLRFSETLNRVAFGKVRVELCRHGKTLAAIVPAEDLERLRDLEDALDAAAARKALAEPGERRPYGELRKELGLSR